MGLSINTNSGASAALQSLNATNRQLATTQSRINTGLNVSSTKDDSSAYTIAQGLRGDLGELKAVTSSLGTAKSVTDVAVAGAEQISDVVNQMKELATKASDTTISAETRKAYNDDFKALRKQVTTIIDSSEFNGTNLLKTGGGTVGALQSLQDKSATPGTTTYVSDTLTVANQELTLATTETKATTATNGVLGADSEIASAADAAAMKSTLEVYGKKVDASLSTLGSASRQIDNQITFTSKLSDTIETASATSSTPTSPRSPPSCRRSRSSSSWVSRRCRSPTRRRRRSSRCSSKGRTGRRRRRDPPVSADSGSREWSAPPRLLFPQPQRYVTRKPQSYTLRPLQSMTLRSYYHR